MNKRILPILLATMAVTTAMARKVADFFIEAPMYEAAPYLDANMRMDLLDYFRSDLPSKTTNMFDEPAAILNESDRSISVNAGRGVQLEYGLAVKGADSLLVVIETLPTPMPDSKISLFTTRWAPGRPAMLAPALSDWLTDEGRANRARVEEIIPFITASASFAPDGGNKIAITPTIGQYFAPDDSIAAEVGRYIKPQLVYEYNGKTFVEAR